MSTKTEQAAVTAAVRSGATDTPLPPQSARVLTLLAAGYNNAGIAELLWLSPHTVKTHIARTFRRLGAHHRAHAVTLALQCGAIHAPGLAATGPAHMRAVELLAEHHLAVTRGHDPGDCQPCRALAVLGWAPTGRPKATP